MDYLDFELKSLECKAILIVSVYPQRISVYKLEI